MLDLKSLIPGEEKRNLPVERGAANDPFQAFRRDVDRLFDNFLAGVGGTPFPTLRNGGVWGTALPSLDVTESDDELVISAELPGMDEKDFEVALDGDVLTIRGEKKYEHEDKEGERRYVERSYGAFSRSVRLPFEPGDQDVNASYKKGVLTVRIPKPAEARNKVKHIEVKAA
ncbi:MAG: Hsp20/alpha crystallin family protein [Methyloligellaceae bacterium]